MESDGLETLVSPNSKVLFEKLSLPMEFFHTPPESWTGNPEYQLCLKRVSSLAVVNDRAERGHALVQDFNTKLTKDEDYLQFLLQVVADHRQSFPNCDKETHCKKQ